VHKQFALVALTGVIVAACSDPTTPAGPSRLAPIAEASGNVQSQVVPDEYIIALRGPTVSTAALDAESRSIAGAAGAELIAVFGKAINGFAVKASAEALAAIRANQRVEYVEAVQVVRKIATQSPVPSWGLDRIDQTGFPLNNSYTYPTGGGPVHVYIIDTGLNTTHNDFTGRVGMSSNHITPTSPTPPAWTDCDGHGTHVAGTTAGTQYGVMKTAIVHAVRVLDCFGSGTTTSLLNGINWVIANAVQPAVSNMSLGFNGIVISVDNATNNMVANGIVSAVAAGNSNADACNFTPARAASAITVGATGNFPAGTPSDARSSFSNFGTCLDIFAPGSGIISASIGSNNATANLSGTSMASPHVAGVAALYRSFNPTHTTTQVANAITTNAVMGVVTNPGAGSPNRLLNMTFIGGGTPNLPPVASFTYTCAPRTPPATGFGCNFNGTGSTDPDGTVASWAWTSPGKPNKTGATTQYAFATAGTYSVTLTVTDNLGATDTETQSIVVGGGGNLPPVADFTFNCVPRGVNIGADCTFNGSISSDPDGTIVSYLWTATNKPNQTGVSVVYSYPSGVSRTVTLTVTDNGGATNTKSVTFTTP